MNSKQKKSYVRSCFSKDALVVLVVLLTFTSCTPDSPPPPPEASGTSAYQEGVPGGAIVDTFEVSARVSAIDKTNRKATLLGPDGDEFTVKVGPEAVNFDQVEVGDLVKASVTEELIFHLIEEGATMPEGRALKALGYIETGETAHAPDGTTGIVALAMKGAQPGGLVAETTQITGTVTAIDLSKRTATLRFQDGSTKTFPVRSDVDLSKRKVGEQVVFRATEMIAISVEKP